MSYTLVKPEDRDEWLKFRLLGIGSSEIGTILGYSRFQTPYELMQIKRGEKKRTEETMIMKLGHYLEPVIAQCFEDETGFKIDKSSEGDWLAILDGKEHIRVSPDRLYTNEDGETCICECKSTRLTIEPELIPKAWFAQLQLQMGVMGIKHGAIAWLTNGTTFGYRLIEYVPLLFDFLCKKIDEFWFDSVIGGKMPRMYSHDADMAFLSSTDTAIEASKDIIKAVDRLIIAKQAIKDNESIISDCEAIIKQYMATNELLTCGGNIIATWKQQKGSQRFDITRFKKENLEQYQSYLSQSESSRRFTVK